MISMSSELMVKSSFKLSSILSLVTLFTSGALPCCSAYFTHNCATLTPQRSATSLISLHCKTFLCLPVSCMLPQQYFFFTVCPYFFLQTAWMELNLVDHRRNLTNTVPDNPHPDLIVVGCRRIDMSISAFNGCL